MNKFIWFGKPALAPAAWLDFANAHPDQAQIKPVPPVEDSNAMVNTLTSVNEQVNSNIEPRLDRSTGWRIWPQAGDCSDYAVTKRSELIGHAGFDSGNMLIAEVRTPEDEPHAVLVVRTTSGDYVLDNRNPMIYTWNDVGYTWIRIQSPENPNHWRTIETGSPEVSV